MKQSLIEELEINLSQVAKVADQICLTTDRPRRSDYNGKVEYLSVTIVAAYSRKLEKHERGEGIVHYGGSSDRELRLKGFIQSIHSTKKVIDGLRADIMKLPKDPEYVDLFFKGWFGPGR